MDGSWHQPHCVVQMFAPGGGGKVLAGGPGRGGRWSGLWSGLCWGDICALAVPGPHASTSPARATIVIVPSLVAPRIGDSRFYIVATRPAGRRSTRPESVPV